MADFTLTLQHIPAAMYARLCESAEKNHRSLNTEILARLESTLAAPLLDPEERMRGLKAFTDKQRFVDHELVDVFKRRGRS